MVLPQKCPLRCCKFNMMAVPVQNEAGNAWNGEAKLLPLKDVFISAKASGAFATVDVNLTYSNPSPSSAIEATYEFPLEKHMIVGKLEAEIDGKKIEAVVKDKENAREKFDDAVAAGNTAVLAERSTEKKEVLTIKLGNLPPQQDALLKLQLIMQLDIVNGAYFFELPSSFYPDYSRHGVEADAFNYGFNYEL